MLHFPFDYRQGVKEYLGRLRSYISYTSTVVGGNKGFLKANETQSAFLNQLLSYLGGLEGHYSSRLINITQS